MTGYSGSHDAALRLLGLARRAGKVAAGRAAAQEAVQRGQASLVMLASDAAQRTIRDFEQVADRARVPVVTLSTKVTMGSAVGSTPKAVCAVCDRHIASGIISALEQ